MCLLWGSCLILKYSSRIILLKSQIMLPNTIIYNKHFVHFLDIRYQTPLLIRSGITGLQVTYAADEKALFQETANIIKRYCFYFLTFPAFFPSPFVLLLSNVGEGKQRESESFPVAL